MNQDSNGNSPDDKKAGWERSLLTELATNALKEKRTARRWGIFFKLLGFFYLFAILGLLAPETWDEAKLDKEPHTALVDVAGVIAPGGEVDADDVAEALRAAFEDKDTKGLILRINSPGGSPVQSSYIYREIRRLREKYPKIPVYAVVGDICASGGYYIAAAADEIYVNESSIVGSIGVIMSSFGFVDTMEKLGVERRLQTAGEHKAILDPFSPQSSFDTEHMQTMLDQLHDQFVKAVKDGRGERLSDDPALFSGLFWSGEQSVKMGLADGFASPGQVAREIIEAEKIVDFTVEEGLLERLSSRLGSSLATAFARATGMAAEGLPR